MFDISNPDYLAAWATAVETQLGAGGWTGVELVDAGNLPAWTNSPIDPNTGQDMTVSDHARYLAEAMAEVRGGLKSNNFAVIAQNQPFTIIDPHQIASSDAVSVERGFARLRGSAWTALYTYFEAALDSRVGAWVWDGGNLDHQQRVFGLASYLLVSGLWSGYSVLPGTERALYRAEPRRALRGADPPGRCTRARVRCRSGGGQPWSRPGHGAAARPELAAGAAPRRCPDRRQGPPDHQLFVAACPRKVLCILRRGARLSGWMSRAHNTSRED